MNPRRPLLPIAILALGAAAGTARAQDVPMTIVPLVGEPRTGTLTSIDEDGTVTFDDGSACQLVDVVELVREPAPNSDHPGTDRSGFVALRSGNRLAVDFMRGDGSRVQLLSPYGPMELGIEHLAAIRFAAENPDDDGGFVTAVQSPPSSHDYVFAWTRDDGLKRYSMLVDGCDGDVLRVTAGGRSRDLPTSRVYGVVFGHDRGFAPPTLPKPIVTVDCSSGPSITGRLVHWRGGECALGLAEGPVLRIDTSAVRRVSIDSGRATFLSKLEPSEVRHTPALNRDKPWLRDATPLGTGIVLGDRTYRSGLCLPPRTTLTYPLDGSYDVFEATVGIDSRSSRDAHAVLRVLLDDQVVFDSGAMTVSTPPRLVVVPIAGAKRLAVEADFGQNLDLGDHCVFAGARLRKD
ncbi:MAG: NPCBM/NEW2 domain-containing protein [Planctomycetes bacterium]|nr:NPCBM/NEW2 domain-containing protein [Planctomycetota bacterium]